MNTDLFDFDLPEDRIALRPARPRDAAKLLVVTPGAEPEFSDRVVRDLPDLLRPGDALVYNNTKVIPARLVGRRERDGSVAGIEATLLARAGPDSWRALVRPAKRLKVGDRIRFGESGAVCLLGTLDAIVAEKGEGGDVLLAFDFTGATLDEAIEAAGEVPLPPYIARARAPDPDDRNDYQTIFAARDGAVAAPTAGLHFTPDLLARLEARGISRFPVTLHVGAGTFLPVKADDISDHRLHAEWGEIGTATAERLAETRARGGRIVAIGTTTLRLLESAVDADGRVRSFQGETSIFLKPGHRFRAADALMTNFHLPRSTLFMLVAAFSGLDRMKRAYSHAVARGYRFYSYGDACLLFPAPSAA